MLRRIGANTSIFIQITKRRGSFPCIVKRKNVLVVIFVIVQVLFEGHHMTEQFLLFVVLVVTVY